MLSRKPVWVVARQAEKGEVERHYNFCSLLALGVGGTIGSGVFVLTGQVARNLAGPAVCISWLVAGAACIVTALSYAELTTVITTSGSTYAFAYVGLGEAFAVVAAWLLSLEYAISAAAVSRSWGDKVAFWVQQSELVECSRSGGGWCSINNVAGSSFNPPAGLLVLAATALQLRGLSLGRITTNILVFLKVCLVLFVVLFGLAFADVDNLTPFIPSPCTYLRDFNKVEETAKRPIAKNASGEFIGGVQGVLTGASVTFFGFLGFDEVAGLSAEAINPKRDVPAAILSTVSIITVLYFLSSLVLASMLPYSSISADEAFGSAFLYVGQPWAMHLLVFGEIILVLPVVVLVSLIPQPRLLYALAEDGLAPSVFSKVDNGSNYRTGTIFTGSIAGFVALFVPFESLNDLISGGILLSFVLANCSNILIRTDAMRNGGDRGHSKRTRPLLSLLAFCLLTSVASIISTSELGIGVVACLVAAWTVHLVSFRDLLQRREVRLRHPFEVPCLPIVAGIAIQLDIYLLTRLSSAGVLQTVVLLLIALFYYFSWTLLVSRERKAWKNGLEGFDSLEEDPMESSGIELRYEESLSPT